MKETINKDHKNQIKEINRTINQNIRIIIRDLKIVIVDLVEKVCNGQSKEGMIISRIDLRLMNLEHIVEVEAEKKFTIGIDVFCYI